MKFKCTACETECECVGEKEINPRTSLPRGWYCRCIDEKDYILCEVCGSIRQFSGGLSAYLMDRLDLDERARCDFSNDPTV